MRAKVPFPVVAAVLMAVMVVVAGVVLWPVENDFERTPGSTVLESMPSAPAERWRLSASDVLGTDDPHASLTIRAETEDVLVVEGTREPYDRSSTLAGVDERTGRVLWSHSAPARQHACAVSDGTLACVRNVRNAGDAVARVHFSDLRTGAEQTAAPVRVRGVPSISSIAGGFLVAVARDDAVTLPQEGPNYGTPTGERGARRSLIIRFSTDGERSWSVDGLAGENSLQTAVGSGLFVMQEPMRRDFSIYRVDTGRRVHGEASSTAPACSTAIGRPGMVLCTSITNASGTQSGFTRPEFVLYDGGFAVDPAGGEPGVEFYDETGRRTATASGWSLPDDDHTGLAPRLVERDTIPVTAGDRVAVLDAATGAARWTRDVHAVAMRPLDADRIAVATDSFESGDRVRRTWQVVDADSGESAAAVSTLFGRWLFGYDGHRLIFAGDPAWQQQPNVPRLAAYDAESGEQRWEFDPVEPLDLSAAWQRGSRHLHLVSAAGHGPGWIARYAS